MWASGAAQAAHVVRIILRFKVSFGGLRGDEAFLVCKYTALILAAKLAALAAFALKVGPEL